MVMESRPPPRRAASAGVALM
uniref:Uncharacterized protein n=1 Tax=Arundo donax TaxID=35708 RepID=A0A0A9FUP3_ARUDO